MPERFYASGFVNQGESETASLVPGSPGAKFSRFHPALVIRSRSPSSKPVQHHFPDEASRRSDGVTGWVEACNGALMFIWTF